MNTKDEMTIEDLENLLNLPETMGTDERRMELRDVTLEIFGYAMTPNLGEEDEA